MRPASHPPRPTSRWPSQAGTTPATAPCTTPVCYTIGTNPAAVHEAWADFSAANDPMMIVNGFQSTNQKVWSQSVTAPTCSTPGSKVTYDFTANATNILPPEYATNHGLDAPGANIEVTINGVSIGSQDLTGINPGRARPVRRSRPGCADDGGHRLEQRHRLHRQRLRNR